MIKIICKQCYKTFLNYPSNDRKFCSQECFWINKTGKPSNKRNKHYSHLQRNNSSRWKGESAKYVAIHMWVSKYKGKPKLCNQCGKFGQKYPNGRWNIQWANIDHKYRRNLNDYIPLCISCHKKNDLKNNSNHNRKLPQF